MTTQEEEEGPYLPVEILEGFIIPFFCEDRENGPLVWEAICSFVCSRWRAVVQERREKRGGASLGRERYKFLEALAWQRHFNLLKWVAEKGCPWGPNTLSAIAAHGDKEMLLWALERHNTVFWMTGLAYGGHLELLKYFSQKQKEQKGTWMWDSFYTTSAAEGGQIEVLEWLHEQGCPFDASACAAAARVGKIDVLKWLHEHGCPWNTLATSAAARAGNLEILKFLHEHGCPWDGHCCVSALKGGHVELLKWLRAQGCPWDYRAAKQAVVLNDRNLLEWMLLQGCPNDCVCTQAATTGNLELLKWAREEMHCPWSQWTYQAAEKGKHFYVLRWLQQNGCEVWSWSRYRDIAAIESAIKWMEEKDNITK